MVLMKKGGIFMKHFLKTAAALLLTLVFACPAFCDRLNYSDMKCLWISQFDLRSVYCSGGQQRNQEEFIKCIETILDNAAASGFNTVIVQMRPNADSMYPSEYYPPSAYVVGAYGKEFAYDPVKIIVDEAHTRNLSIQAWINPIRAVSIDNIRKTNRRYVIRQWYDNPNTNGRYIVRSGELLYLNPAYEEVRQLIISGARELVSKYDVDGLHMDDYFYPTTNASFDAAAYAKYKSGGKSLADFRRGNLNTLVKGIHDAVKSVDSELLFGISPAGNLRTVYNSQYADVYLWCSKPGYIDYICPQIYFGMEHQNFGFVRVAQQWHGIMRSGSGVKLLIGMSLGKALSRTDKYAGTGRNEWRDRNDVLKRCLEYTKELPECTGAAYFCYQYFYNPLTGVSVAGTAAERKNFLPVLQEISWQK